MSNVIIYSKMFVLVLLFNKLFFFKLNVLKRANIPLLYIEHLSMLVVG